MTLRLYEPAAYAPPASCWWADTVPLPVWPVLSGDHRTDVCILGGGFTGLSAGVHLAASGVRVTLLEAQAPGFGASGRNGGFCCLGGSKLSSATLNRRYGPHGLADWRAAEIAAIATVQDVIRQHDMQVDHHGLGEICLAHTPRHGRMLQKHATALEQEYGSGVRFHAKTDLPGLGIGGSFHGGLYVPFGLGLNPRKYHHGLAMAAKDAGVLCHAHSPATKLQRDGSIWRVSSPGGTIAADHVIVATNGYASDDLLPWLAGRYLPVQSSVLVTRPLTAKERAAQGWSTDLMAYDSRNLLHYFRMLPDGRFLFGMRGGIRSTPRAEQATLQKLTHHFQRMFPKWRQVDISHRWQGLACLMTDGTPFVGPVPGQPGLHIGMGYHGNGIAMGTFAGRHLAHDVLGSTGRLPGHAVLRAVPPRMPLGRWRRAVLWPLYLGAWIGDL